MRIFSGLTGLVLLILAVVFALSNRQEAAIGFWPFGASLEAPLSVLIIASLAIGLILGAFFAWIAMLPHRLADYRMRQDMASLHSKLDALRQEMPPPHSP